MTAVVPLGSPVAYSVSRQLEEMAYFNIALDQQTIYDIGRSTT